MQQFSQIRGRVAYLDVKFSKINTFVNIFNNFSDILHNFDTFLTILHPFFTQIRIYGEMWGCKAAPGP